MGLNNIITIFAPVLLRSSADGKGEMKPNLSFNFQHHHHHINSNFFFSFTEAAMAMISDSKKTFDLLELLFKNHSEIFGTNQ
jgi:hypothetical protein